jgi:putative oxidoreductase
MTSFVSASALPKPLIPAIAPLTDALAPLAWPLIRVTIGLMLMPHGAQKLFGLFGGYGLSATAGFFEAKLGLAPGLFFALSAGLIEFAGGLFLALGLFTRPMAAAVTALMAVAVFNVHLASGFFWTQGGYEYPLLWGLVSLAFVLAGGGAFSLDRRIGREV